MRHRDVSTAGDAVERLLPHLTPSAVLMADGAGSAVVLLCRALSAPRALDSPHDARQALARDAVGRHRWAAEQVIESLPPAAHPGDDPGLADALRALPDRERAAVVLELVAGVPSAGAAAAVARLRADLVRRDEEFRRERAQAGLLFRRPGSAPDIPEPSPDLRDRLARLAAERPLPDGATGTVVAAVASARRARRRRRLGVVAGVLAAAVVIAVAPRLPDGPGRPDTASVYAGPTRGSLAGDARFLESVRDSGWAQAERETGVRRVVFAGDVPGGRWALVAAGGTPSRPATTAWFAGPAGAAPDRMELSSIRVAPDPAQPVSLTDPGTGALVVVGAPGDRVRVSDRPQVDAEGTVTRRFRPVPMSEGVAVVGLVPVPDAVVSAVKLDMTRDGRRLDVRPPPLVADPPAASVEATIDRLRPPAPPVVGDAAVSPRLRALLSELGEPVGGTPVTALWSGDLPGPNDQPARLTLLAVPQASGAVVVTAPYGYAADPGGATGSSWCGTGVLPAGLPLDQRVVAVQCDLSDLAADREISRFLVVVGPRSAASVRLLDPDGAVLREAPLTDGVLVVRSPGEVTRVSVTTADGGTSEALPLVDSDPTG